jgi:hypothetical protein
MTRVKRTTGGRRSGRTFDLFDNQMPVRRYKLLLQSLLQRRQRGIGQAIADATGTNPSFVSQITSPAYDVPLPVQHLHTIIDTAGFSSDEERTVIEAYLQAHPERTDELLDRGHSRSDSRTIEIIVPILSSERAQRHFEAAIQRVVAEFAAYAVLHEREINSAPNDLTAGAA